MNSLISRPAVRPVPALALAVALLFAVLLALPAPAQAHDTLLSTDPADGTSLETSPEEITFTFSSDILDVSPLVRVSDDSGEKIAEIVPTVDGPTATATLEEPLPAGTYDIQWRVVSSDGHPIEGTLTLTVEQDPAAEEDPATEEEAAEPSDNGGESADSAGESSQDQPTAEDGQDSSAAAEESTESAQDGGLSMPVLLGILAVVVLGAVIAGVVSMRRRD